MRILSLFIGCCLIILLASYTFVKEKRQQVNEETPIWTVLTTLGEPLPNHVVKTEVEGVSIQRGADIVLRGVTVGPNGRKIKKQSKHFVCTSCHNTAREVHNLNLSDDPDARLDYAAKNNLPFLQGSTLHGIVNRTSFYNGDYEKKYGDLVKPTRNNLREAIHLCAVECSQGRALKDWEMESVLAYLWSLELKMKDLNLGEEGWKKFNAAYATKANPSGLAKWLKNLYPQAAGATFVDPPADRKTGMTYEGNADNGKLIYDLSCKHCHENERYSFFNIDDAPHTFKYLKKNFPKHNRFSVYGLARYGTKPLLGKRAYMPNYTLEKMSHEQLEDLRIYIEKMAAN